jgi:ATP-dependent helicase/nuclease subunit A
MGKNRSTPPDQKYRDRIARELDLTMLVEAAAGTGKTTCLISRMIGLIREGKCRIETLAAVTFTRKAAAELRTRFQIELEKACRKTEGKQHELLVEALNHIERCFIGTIHSFCARLVRERPVEAGVSPDFVELDEVLDVRLREEAWREHVANLITTDAPILPELEELGLKVSPATKRSSSVMTELDELGLEPAELGPAFMDYAQFPDVDEWPAEPVPLPNLKPCIKALRAYAAHMQSLQKPQNPGNDKLLPKYDLIPRMVKRLEIDKPAPLMEVLEQFQEFDNRDIVQKNWLGGKNEALPELNRWNKFSGDYATPLLLAWREHRYEPVMRAILPAREVYDRLRRDRNALNFQDLLLVSLALLRDKPEVRRYFRERFTHLLVDEFQDTDPIQAEVMLLLTADDCNQKKWRDCRPVSGSLFIVGDPKQSIYRFRRADILTYNKVREIVVKSGGQVIPLTANFRSIKPIVKWINGCFSGVFPSEADDYNPADRPLDVGRNDGADAEDPIQRILVPAAIKRKDVAANYDADLIARFIRRAIDEKWPVPRTDSERQHGLPDYARSGDFLIVARYKTLLTIYARKLQEHGLPHSVTGGCVLNEVPELELLYTCLRAVARPFDQIALVAVLRSELFGIADTTLYSFRKLGGAFSYHSPLPEALSQEEKSVLKDAFGRLRTYSGWLHRLPAAAAIERIAADLGLVARACAVQEGDAHAGSLLKSIELLRSVDGPLTMGDYLETLENLVDYTESHDGVPVRPPSEAPVEVMNLHQCKGLEAPFVFLVDPAGDSDHDVAVHIDRTDETPRGYLAIYGQKRSEWKPPPRLAQPKDWVNLAAEEKRFLDAETNRLLYVAATRAGVKLVTSQRDGNANSKNPWRLFGTQPFTDFADPGAIVEQPSEEIVIDAKDWNKELAAIETRWKTILLPSYAVAAIKKAAIKGGPKPHGAEKDGAEWGKLLHLLLEAAMKEPSGDLRGLALSALEDLELSVDLVDDAVHTVERVIGSDLWKRAQKSECSLAEVPLSLCTPDDGGLPTVFRGVIDLAFLESNSWVIVDYKSEGVEESEIPALVAYYKPQIDAYAEAWEKITGQRVSERGLFFTHSSRYVTV